MDKPGKSRPRFRTDFKFDVRSTRRESTQSSIYIHRNNGRSDFIFGSKGNTLTCPQTWMDNKPFLHLIVTCLGCLQPPSVTKLSSGNKVLSLSHCSIYALSHSLINSCRSFFHDTLLLTSTLHCGTTFSQRWRKWMRLKDGATKGKTVRAANKRKYTYRAVLVLRL